MRRLGPRVGLPVGRGFVAETKAGEGWVWALGVFGLLGLAVPVSLFSDLPMICGISATAPGAGEDAAAPRETIVWLALAGLAGEDRAKVVRDRYASQGYLACAKKAVVADSLFLVFYGGLLSIAATLVGRGWELSGRPGARRVYLGVLVLVLLAAAFDLVENFGLLRMLDESPRMELAGRTAVCAVVKFALLVTALAAIALGGVPLLFRVRKGAAGVVVLAGLVGMLAAAGAVGLAVGVAGAWNSLPAPTTPAANGGGLGEDAV
jgi:hypothetical protein